MTRRGPKPFRISVLPEASSALIIGTIEAIPGEAELVRVRAGRKTIARLPRPELLRIKLDIGDVWTADLRDRVAAALRRIAAKSFAERSNASRPKAKSKLATILVMKGLPRQEAQVIVDDLAERGLINEAALAESAAASTLARRPSGERLLVAKLRAKGLDQATSATAARRAMADLGVSALDMARSVGQRKIRTFGPKLDAEARQRRLYGTLARRGFDPDICSKVVRELIPRVR